MFERPQSRDGLQPFEVETNRSCCATSSIRRVNKRPAINLVSSEEEPMSAASAVVVVHNSQSKEEERDNEVDDRARARHSLWIHHDGFGLCCGSNRLPCFFGVDGAAASAAQLATDSAISAAPTAWRLSLTECLRRFHISLRTSQTSRSNMRQDGTRGSSV